MRIDFPSSVGSAHRVLFSSPYSGAVIVGVAALSLALVAAYYLMSCSFRPSQKQRAKQQIQNQLNTELARIETNIKKTGFLFNTEISEPKSTWWEVTLSPSNTNLRIDRLDDEDDEEEISNEQSNPVYDAREEFLSQDLEKILVSFSKRVVKASCKVNGNNLTVLHVKNRPSPKWEKDTITTISNKFATDLLNELSKRQRSYPELHRKVQNTTYNTILEFLKENSVLLNLTEIA